MDTCIAFMQTLHLEKNVQYQLLIFAQYFFLASVAHSFQRATSPFLVAQLFLCVDKLYTEYILFSD